MVILIAVLALLSALVVGLIVVALRQPDEFRVVRSTRISAGPATVFEHINDFRAWPAWSPWAKLDPAMRTEFDGPPRGVGAGYSWFGNTKVGQGSMRIVESNPHTKVGIQIEFMKPFRASNRVTFTLTPGSTGTNVAWAMVGKNPLMTKVMRVFMNMDKMIGTDFERGLSSLKAIAEQRAAS